MRRRITIALSLLLVGALAAAGTVTYLTFVRSPVNPPAEACVSDRETDGPPRVVAAGASLVQGTLGADWVGEFRDLHRSLEVINAGRNGDTSAGLLNRVESDIVACVPDAVMILIGTNDVRDDVPVERYRANLDAIIEGVKTGTGAQIALISLPPLGEDLTALINQTLTGFNDAIQQSATEAGVGYLPLYELITTRLLEDGTSRPEYDFSFLRAFTAAARHHLLRQSWDDIAHSAGLEFFVDHIHLSDRSGALLTDLTSTWLTGQAVVPSARLPQRERDFLRHTIWSEELRMGAAPWSLARRASRLAGFSAVTRRRRSRRRPHRSPACRWH